MKRQPLQNGRKFLQIIDLIKDSYLEYVKNSYDSVTKTHPTKKQVENLSRHFSRGDNLTFNKHMKRYSASLVIREMQIKAT